MPISTVIKYESSPSALIYHYPETDFNTASQLIVHESQEAIFFRNGQALDLFPAGRYTLETLNIPLIKGILNLPTGGVSPFHCEVYFINKVATLNLKWGTKNAAEVIDPKFQILLNIGASGALGLCVSDSRKLLLKLVGTGNELTAEQLQSYFRDVIAMRVKAYLTRIMSEVSFVVVNQQLEDISAALNEKLSTDLDEYGVKLVNFYLSTIYIPDEDKQKVKDALNRVSARSIEGISWTDEQVADIAKRYASNEGAGGSAAGMVAQAPLAFAFGQMLSDTAGPSMKVAFTTGTKAFGSEVTHPASVTPSESVLVCGACGATLPADCSFCPKCGKPVQIEEAFCAKCGRKLQPDDNFCPKCGTKRAE